MLSLLIRYGSFETDGWVDGRKEREGKGEKILFNSLERENSLSIRRLETRSTGVACERRSSQRLRRKSLGVIRKVSPETEYR